jgi:hypothetical protein
MTHLAPGLPLLFCTLPLILGAASTRATAAEQTYTVVVTTPREQRSAEQACTPQWARVEGGRMREVAVTDEKVTLARDVGGASAIVVSMRCRLAGGTFTHIVPARVDDARAELTVAMPAFGAVRFSIASEGAPATIMGTPYFVDGARSETIVGAPLPSVAVRVTGPTETRIVWTQTNRRFFTDEHALVVFCARTVIIAPGVTREMHCDVTPGTLVVESSLLAADVSVVAPVDIPRAEHPHGTGLVKMTRTGVSTTVYAGRYDALVRMPDTVGVVRVRDVVIVPHRETRVRVSVDHGELVATVTGAPWRDGLTISVDGSEGGSLAADVVQKAIVGSHDLSVVTCRDDGTLARATTRAHVRAGQKTEARIVMPASSELRVRTACGDRPCPSTIAFARADQDPRCMGDGDFSTTHDVPDEGARFVVAPGPLTTTIQSAHATAVHTLVVRARGCQTIVVDQERGPPNVDVEPCVDDAIGADESSSAPR